MKRQPMSTEIRGHVEAAHDRIRIAQKLAYDYRRREGMIRTMAPWRIRTSLNKAQQALIWLLVHR